MKGVIIAAGYGTRFLPCTKTIPKEMFPLVDTPAIDLVVDEFIESGIKDILIVSSRRKKTLEDYFDREVELESVFKTENDTKKLSSIKMKDINIYFTRQHEMKGTGDAIMKAKSFVGNDPFIVAYPDDLVFSDIPLSKQLIEIYEKTKSSVLSLEEVDGDVSRYGVCDIEKTNKELIRVKKIVEKPKKGEEPSKVISVGRYLFTSELFELLEEDYKNFCGKEFYHINAINTLGKNNKLYGVIYRGERVDVGDKLGYIEGIIKYALTRDDLKDGVKNILNKYSK